jgi:serine/threonine protein kinase
MTSHMDAVVNPTDVAGSRNWLAPERLVGQTLRYPCDIYSFGMTLYEVRIFAPACNQPRHYLPDVYQQCSIG